MKDAKKVKISSENRDDSVVDVVVNDTQSDSIQYLNFAKK